MNVGKRLIAGLITVLGLATVLVTFGGSSAWAYPPGTAPTLTVSASTVVQGGTLTLIGSHFSGPVDLVGHTAAVDLGTAEASGPDGTFTKTVTITAADFPAGNHTIVATDAVGDSASVSFSVEATGTGGNAGSGGSSGGNSGSGGLAYTGVAVLSVGGVGVLLLIGGGIMLMAGKRRKATV